MESPREYNNAIGKYETVKPPIAPRIKETD